MYKTIIYFGNDPKFSSELERNFQAYRESDFSVHYIFCEFNLIGDFPHYFFQVVDYKAQVIILDFTDIDIVEELNYLVHMWRTCLETRDVTICGIVPSVKKSKKIEEYYNKGLNLVYTKDVEADIISSDSFFLGMGKRLKQNDFAMARIKDEFEEYKFVDGMILGKIGYLSDQTVQIEVNVDIPEEGIDDFEFIFQADLLTKLRMEEFDILEKATGTAKTSLDPFWYTYYLPIPYSSSEINSISKIEVRDYIEEKKEELVQNVVEILVIDDELSLYRVNSDKLMSSDYKLNYATYLSDDLEEINFFRPNIIMFQLSLGMESGYGDDDLEENKKRNDFITLEKIIEKIRQNKDYRPFIMIFKNMAGDKATNEMLNYPFILSTPKSLDQFDIKDFVRLYKNSSKYISNYVVRDIDLEKSVVFTNTTRENTLYSNIPLDVIFLTECEVIFACPLDLADEAIVYIPPPYGIYITVIKIDREISGYPMSEIYKGIINAVSEEKKRSVRLLVNDIIFSPLKKIRELEQKRIEDKKKSYQAQKTKEVRSKAEEGRGTKEVTATRRKKRFGRS